MDEQEQHYKEAIKAVRAYEAQLPDLRASGVELEACKRCHKDKLTPDYLIANRDNFGRGRTLCPSCVEYLEWMADQVL